jgi:hypothetical protein
VSRRGAQIAFVVTAALALARVVLAIAEPASARTNPDPEAYSGGAAYAILPAIVLVAFAALGTMVVSREPRNAVGWVLVVIPLSLGVLIVSDRLFWLIALNSGATGGAAAYAAWLANWAWIPAIVPTFTILPLLFPTGETVSRRWRVLLWTALAAGIATFAGTAFAPGPLDAFRGVDNPISIDSPVVAIVGRVGFFVLVPTALASIVSLGVRFRRSHGVERQQLKWVVAAAALLPVAFTGAGFGGKAGFLILTSGLLVVAGAVAIAMLRYRLYDIDVVINRALVYGALSAMLAATYLGTVLLLQVLIAPLTEKSDLAIAGSTLAVAGLFRPARRRIQATVDRRFYRSRYDAARTLEAFGARLRDEVDLETLTVELRAVIGSTMQPSHVTLWLRGTEQA